MTELRELLARAIYASAWWVSNPAGFEGITSGMRDDIFREVNAIIAALKANGLVAVPTTITQEMLDEMCYDTWEKDFQPFWRDCLSASPYAKEFE